MIIKSKYKICRRLGPIYEKCQTQKFVLSSGRKAKATKGKRPKQLSDFGAQLIEKQKIRFSYGMSEKQFSNYVKEAETTKGMAIADKLFELLETRLDNVVYRLGLANTRALARQMVSHGHFTVNGKKTTVPSYHVRAGDIISAREGSRKSVLFADIEKKLKNYSIPAWLSFDAVKIEAAVKEKPKNTETFLDFNTVLEYYSR
ncbi:MAG: 30S ribosomal protein S4 [Candidatus Paceibacterota bacterium]|jgi:small subunit ribosomal protein S4